MTSDIQNRLGEFKTEEEVREFWIQHSKENYIRETLEEMYQRAPEVRDDIDYIWRLVTEHDHLQNYQTQFPTIDVFAFAIFLSSSAPVWKVYEDIGGIDEENFYYMFNTTYTNQEVANGVSRSQHKRNRTPTDIALGRK